MILLKKCRLIFTMAHLEEMERKVSHGCFNFLKVVELQFIHLRLLHPLWVEAWLQPMVGTSQMTFMNFY